MTDTQACIASCRRPSGVEEEPEPEPEPEFVALLVLARELKRGDHIRWHVLDLLVERVVLDPLASVVSVTAGGRVLVFDWDERIERVDDA